MRLPSTPGMDIHWVHTRLLRALGLALLGLALGASAGGCDNEATCSGVCPTGTRFTNAGNCVCEPFDAGYCAHEDACADAFCPASSAPDACGGGQLWSTTICGCYPLPSTAAAVAGDPADGH